MDKAKEIVTLRGTLPVYINMKKKNLGKSRKFDFAHIFMVGRLGHDIS